jgi:hypothetical protein
MFISVIDFNKGTNCTVKNIKLMSRSIVFERNIRWRFHGAIFSSDSPPSIAKLKEWVELYLHSPNTPSWRCAHLKEKA